MVRTFKSTIALVIFFLFAFHVKAQQPVLTGKKWIIAEAGITDNIKYAIDPKVKPQVIFYSKDSVKNKFDYSKIEMYFFNGGTYQAKNNLGTVYNGSWSLNTAGDSLTTDDTLLYRLDFIDPFNCIINNGNTEIIDTLGTVDTMYSYLKLYGVPDITSVDEQAAAFIKVYPVPVKESLTVDLFYKNYREARLYNVFGQLVKTVSVQNKSVLQINVEELTAGYYSLEIISNDGERVVRKVIKE